MKQSTEIPKDVKSIPWRLAESPHTGTCTILQEMINRFLCSFIIFLKSKTYQLYFDGCD